MSANTLPPSSLPAFPWSSRWPCQLALSGLSLLPTPISDMSNEPGVQILGVRSKVSNIPEKARGASEVAAILTIVCPDF